MLLSEKPMLTKGGRWSVWICSWPGPHIWEIISRPSLRVMGYVARKPDPSESASILHRLALASNPLREVIFTFLLDSQT
jgi:hypothetical protein